MATVQAHDWQSNRTLVQCNQHVLLNEIGCDVTFQVGTKKIENISAHKVLLANRSSVFFTMFYGSLPESDMITITDIEPDVFREFLGYIYTDQVILKMDNVCLILYAANKYSMQNLMLKCSSFLQSNIFTGNVCTIMENAHTFDLQTLFQKCKTFILDNSSEILTSFGLINLCSRCLKSIISSDGLGENEYDIFNVVMVWAENQCNKMKMPITTENKRHVLGDLLYEIRFPLMDAKQFTEIAETGILTEVEQLDVFKVISKGKTASTKFTSRCRVPCEQICMLRDLKTTSSMSSMHDERHTYNKFGQPIEWNSSTLTVAASATIELKGIVLHSTDRRIGIIKVTCSESNRNRPNEWDPYGDSFHHKQKQTPKEMEKLLSVTEVEKKDQGQCMHVRCMETFYMAQGKTYALHTTICPKNTKEYSQYLPICRMLQRSTKVYKTIEQIPSDPRSPVTFENESQNHKWIVGLSYKRITD